MAHQGSLETINTNIKATIITNEMKIDDDELNCVQESIVHNDDHRIAITESEYKQEDIIKCIGQLQSDFKYIQNEYEQKGSTWGTATVFKILNNKCYALSAAHNIAKQVKKCKQCMKYMDNSQNIIECIHCKHNQLEIEMIEATTIRFRRREIKKHASVYDEDEKETTHYEFGDN
eukprot:118774_1